MNEAQDSTEKKPRSIFRAEALDQLSSPEQLEQLLQVTNRKSWITLATLGFLILVVLLWSVFGRIPVTVNGTGILIYPRQVMPFQASVQGQLSSMNIAVGDRVPAGQVIATVSVPDIAQRLDQELMRLERMEGRHATLGELQQKRLGLETKALQHRRDVLEDRISSANAMAKALRGQKQGPAHQNPKRIPSIQLVPSGAPVVPVVPTLKSSFLDSKDPDPGEVPNKPRFSGPRSI